MSVEFLYIPKVLPLAPRPISDELLSSWLCRVATANALSFGELLESARNGYLPRPAGTMDLGLPTAWRIRLSTFCRIPESWIGAIDLQSHFPGRNLAWFTHQRIFRLNPGERSVQLARPFCVHCGHDQRERYSPVYTHADWALAFRTHCPRHLSALIDSCSSCGTITFPTWAEGRFCCLHCRATLKPTHTLSDSPRLRAVVALQEAVRGCFLGGHPDPCWMGPVSRSQFLQTILELIYVLTHRIAQPGLVLSDLIVPDEFRRAYTIGGRFQNPQFSELPWFARFLVLAALNEVLLTFSAVSARTPSPAVPVDQVLSRFFRCLPYEQKARILYRTEAWPSCLKIGFQKAAAMLPQRRGRRFHFVQRLSTTHGPNRRPSTPITYNEFTS